MGSRAGAGSEYIHEVAMMRALEGRRDLQRLRLLFGLTPQGLKPKFLRNV